MSKVINFNSKGSTPKGFHELSNFYGGVEFEYMRARFNQIEILGLFDLLEKCDNATFWNWLQVLNNKKDPSQRQMDYWFTEGGVKNGQPIRGIAAQMLGTMVKNSVSMMKRRKIVAEKLGMDNIEINEELDDEEKKRWMAACLQHKFYTDDYYKNLLLSTGDAVLHEVPLRGNGRNNNWTYKVDKQTGETYGKDWLGKLLMELRDELVLDRDLKF